MQQYLDLLQTIKDKGTWKDAAREGMPRTLSLFGHQMRFNLQDGFPLMTTKKLSFKNIVTELLWFLKGDTNIKYLVDNGCNIWNEDQQNFQNRNNWTEEGSLGYQYPWLWRTWGKENRTWQPKPDFKDPFFTFDLPEIKPSKSKFVGKIIETIQGYKYLIYDYDPLKNIYYLSFTHNGLLWKKKTSKGFEKVEYPYHKTCFNIACIGRIDKNYPLNKKLYSIWRGMINRCYDKNNISYNLYGGKGMYVDNRWLCLEYFIEDVQHLKGWENKLKNWAKYTIEKDFGRGYIYSKNDCIWSQYNFSKLNRPIYYTFENKETGELFKTNNLADFGRKINKEKLINSHSKKLIDGKLQSLGGWKLVKTEDFKNEGIDQIKILIEGLKKNPMSRRHIITAWNPATLNDMALNACHAFVQFNCRPLTDRERVRIYGKITNGQASRLVGDFKDINDDSSFFLPKEHALYLDEYKVPRYYLDCQLYQRSADVFLGVPYNIASYALLTEILCKICNMIPGDFVHTFGDVHCYENHIEQVDEQLKREPGELPKLKFSDLMQWENFNTNEITKFFNACGNWEFQLENYNPQPSIKAKLSTGLK